MAERRYSLANPELCATYCRVPRELPLPEKIFLDDDSGECQSAKENTTGESTVEISLSQVTHESDVTKRSVPTFTFTADECASTCDGSSKQNSKHKCTINLDVRHHSNCNPTSPDTTGGDRGRLVPPDPSFWIGPDSKESVNEDEHSGNASKQSDSSQHMDYLKKITERLQLTTRRPSYSAWKKKYIDDASEGQHTAKAPTINNCTGKEASGEWTPEKKTAIDTALGWLRTSLLEMREQDHALARRLVELRRDIQQLKLQRSYEEHQDILEEAIDMIDGNDTLFDAPPDPFSPTLKHCGVTKMNLSTRRFSVF